MALSIMTLSVIGIIVPFSVYDTEHSPEASSGIMQSVAFFQLLCRMPSCCVSFNMICDVNLAAKNLRGILHLSFWSRWHFDIIDGKRVCCRLKALYEICQTKYIHGKLYVNNIFVHNASYVAYEKTQSLLLESFL